MTTETETNQPSMATVAIEKELRKSYLDYAMSVIVGRALPGAGALAAAVATLVGMVLLLPTLTTAMNSLVAESFGFPKRDIVMAKMGGGGAMPGMGKLLGR